jgi:hypothetical protein
MSIFNFNKIPRGNPTRGQRKQESIAMDPRMTAVETKLGLTLYSLSWKNSAKKTRSITKQEPIRKMIYFLEEIEYLFSLIQPDLVRPYCESEL